LFSTKKISAVSAAAIALFAATAAVAGPMVVRSTGPSAKAFPVGKPLAADARLPLKAGDVVTVLDSGGTRVLKGPGSIAVAGSGAASGSGFGQLIASAGTRQARTGATRSAIGGGPARSPNVWYVDSSKGGAHCIADAASLSLWRPDNSTAATVVVTGVSNGKSVNVDYRAGQSVRAWPTAELPVTDGALFKVTLPGAKTPVTVKAVLLAGSVEGIESTATALLQKGCSNQMDVLVEGSKQETQVASASH
jgi:hypothetical protein